MSGFTQIGAGSSANDGTGDAIRTAMQAVNANYTSTPRVLSTVSDLASEVAASGYVRVVSDLTTGGSFKAVNSGTPDGVDVFTSATVGWTWQRIIGTNVTNASLQTSLKTKASIDKIGLEKLALRLQEAASNNTSLSIACIGDSFFGGSSVDEDSFIFRMRDTLRPKFGDGGFGLLPFNPASRYYEDRFTINKGSMTEIAVFSGGDYGKPLTNAPEIYFSPNVCGLRNDTGSNIDFSVNSENEEFDSVQVFYFKQSGGGTFKIGPDLGNLTTINTSNASNALGYTTVSGFGKNGNGYTVYFQDVNDDVTIYALNFIRSDQYGLRFHNFGHGSVEASEYEQLIDNGDFSGYVIDALACKVSIVHLGFNDFGYDNTISVAEMQSRFQSIIDDITAADSDHQFIFLGTVPNLSIASNMDRVNEAVASVCAANDNCFDVQLENIVGDSEEADERGLLGTDGSHLNKSGNSIVASRLSEILGFENSPSFKSGLMTQIEDAKHYPRCYYTNRASSSSYIDCNNQIITSSNYAFCGFIALNDLSSDQFILSQNSGGSDSGRIVLEVETDGRIKYRIGGVTYSGNKILEVNKWYHILISVNNNTLYIVINGQIDAVYSDITTPTPESANTILCATNSSGSSASSVSIDVFCIFDGVYFDSSIFDTIFRLGSLDQSGASSPSALYEFSQSCRSRLISDRVGSNHATCVNQAGWSGIKPALMSLIWEGSSSGYIGLTNSLLGSKALFIKLVAMGVGGTPTISIGTEPGNKAYLADTVLQNESPDDLTNDLLNMDIGNTETDLYVNTTGAYKLKLWYDSPL